MNRRLPLLALATALAAICLSPNAFASGGPYVPMDGVNSGTGITSPDGAYRYVATNTGDTAVLQRISVWGGVVADERELPGPLGIPRVAVDGTAGGLSSDGSRLVLGSPRHFQFPRERTELRVLRIGERGFHDPDRVVLDGDFSFDALSPDGGTAYLVEYTNRRDPQDYQVRALDLASGELDPKPILDTEEEPGEMRGYPMTRATAPDGTWEYTLYDGGGGEPFIHALDVEHGRTVCIDLPQLDANDAYGAGLAFGEAGSLVVSIGANRRHPAQDVAVVDTGDFSVSAPAASVGSSAADGDGSPLVWAGLAAVALALLAVLTFRRRRGGPSELATG